MLPPTLNTSFSLVLILEATVKKSKNKNNTKTHPKKRWKGPKGWWVKTGLHPCLSAPKKILE